MPKPDGLRMDITPRARDLCLVTVGAQTVDKPQFDDQARRVTDGYHASPSSPMFSLCSHSVSSNCHKQQFDAKPDGLRMDITPRARDLCLVRVCVGLHTNCQQPTI